MQVMNEEQPSTEQPGEVPFVDAPPSDTPQAKRQPDPRSRLRELLAVPERDRSDAVWDEIISLEIDMAPGNRAQPAQGEGGGGRQQQQPGRQQQGRRPEQQARQGQDPAGRNKSGKRFFQKRKRGPGAPNDR